MRPAALERIEIGCWALRTCRTLDIEKSETVFATPKSLAATPLIKDVRFPSSYIALLSYVIHFLENSHQSIKCFNTSSSTIVLFVLRTLWSLLVCLIRQWSPNLGLQMFLDFISQKSWPRLGTTVIRAWGFVAF